MNPNGPLLNGGSRRDNGQTGRKLVMDYYGPRVPLGGGAIYGKDPMHVDRFGARKAREMAIEAVKNGAGECLVRAVYAPNVAEPLDVQVEMTGEGMCGWRSRLVLAGAAARELIGQAVTVSALQRARLERTVHGQEQALTD